MVYTCRYMSPLGGIFLAADDIGLTGLWFDGEKYFAENLPTEHIERETPILTATKRWLDVYFTGKEPDVLPPLHPVGSAFRQEVWQILLNSLRNNHDLWRNRAADGKKKTPDPHVCTSGRRRGRTQ